MASRRKLALSSREPQGSDGQVMMMMPFICSYRKKTNQTARKVLSPTVFPQAQRVQKLYIACLYGDACDGG